MPTQAPTGSIEESRAHRDLGAAAGIAGDRHHLDDAIIDLDLLAEQLGHELRMGARQEDLRPALLATDIGEEQARTRPGGSPARLSSRRMMASPRPRSTMMLPYSTRFTTPDTISLMRSLYSVHCRSRSAFADLLDDHLLGVLGSDAAEIDGGSGSAMKSPTSGGGISMAGIVQRDLGRLVLHRLDDLEQVAEAISPVLGRSRRECRFRRHSASGRRAGSHPIA